MVAPKVPPRVPRYVVRVNILRLAQPRAQPLMLDAIVMAVALTSAQILAQQVNTPQPVRLHVLALMQGATAVRVPLALVPAHVLPAITQQSVLPLALAAPPVNIRPTADLVLALRVLRVAIRVRRLKQFALIAQQGQFKILWDKVLASIVRPGNTPQVLPLAQTYKKVHDFSLL